MLDIPDMIVGIGNTALAAWKYWRIACGVAVVVLMAVVIHFATDSTAIRVIGGFHVFVVMVTIGVMWEQKRGRLKE